MIFEAPETFVFKTWIAQHLGMCQESRVLSKEHENCSKCLGFRQIPSQMVKSPATAVGSGFKVTDSLSSAVDEKMDSATMNG